MDIRSQGRKLIKTQFDYRHKISSGSEMTGQDPRHCIQRKRFLTNLHIQFLSSFLHIFQCIFRLWGRIAWDNYGSGSGSDLKSHYGTRTKVKDPSRSGSEQIRIRNNAWWEEDRSFFGPFVRINFLTSASFERFRLFVWPLYLLWGWYYFSDLPVCIYAEAKITLSDLCILVEVPEVEAAGAVHGGEEGGMDGRPGHVVHVVTVVLKAVQRLILLRLQKCLIQQFYVFPYPILKHDNFRHGYEE